MSHMPLVSVVIPTKGRALLLKRAIDSVLNQTFKNYEIVVVIDGDDPETEGMLKEQQLTNLIICSNTKSVGGAEARNMGVNNSSGEWIAFLDDDDEWLPLKLELQYELAKNSSHKYPICYSKIIGRSPNAEYVWPRRSMLPNEHISNYLLARSSLQQGEGLIQTTMIFTKKELLLKVPFNKGLKRHQEWDWLLRVNNISGVAYEFAPEVLSVWYIEEQRKSVSKQNDWEYSLAWINKNKDNVTPRAYSAFLMTVVSGIAAKQGDIKAFFVIFKELLKGKPALIDFIIFGAIWGLPVNIRRKIRDMVRAR